MVTLGLAVDQSSWMMSSVALALTNYWSVPAGQFSQMTASTLLMLVWGVKVCFAMKSLILTFWHSAIQLMKWQFNHFICKWISKSDLLHWLLQDARLERERLKVAKFCLIGFMLTAAVWTLVNFFGFIALSSCTVNQVRTPCIPLPDTSFPLMQLHVPLVNYDWQVVMLPMKAEWRSVWTTLGVLYVMTPGDVLMLQSCVDNWDIQLKVTYWVYQKNARHCGCKPEQIQALNLPAFHGALNVTLVDSH